MGVEGGPDPIGFDNQTRVDRRTLLKYGASVGFMAAMPLTGFDLGKAFAAVGSPKALTSSQRAIMDAIFERLVPADENGPGAVELGITDYVEHNLTGGVAGGLAGGAPYAPVFPLYAVGLPAVDAYAQSAYGGAFASLPGDQQDAVLEDMLSGKATGFPPRRHR